MAIYHDTHESQQTRQKKIVLFVIALMIGFLLFTGLMMVLYYFNLLTPWGLVFMVPFSLVVLPWMILKILPWLSRKVTGDRSNIDFRHFADPQPRNLLDNEGNKS